MLIAWIVFFPIAAAFAVYLTGRHHEHARDLAGAAVTAAVFLLALGLPSARPSLDIGGILVNGLHFMTDGFRAVYGIVTAFMWLGTSVFSLEYFRHEREGLNRYWFFVLVTLGATEGVMPSADLMTTFVFFEMLSFTSFTWVIHEETPEAVRAGYTYLFIAVIGGLVLFMGLLLLMHACGTLDFRELKEAVRTAGREKEILAAGICILFGFGAKAGMFPVHIWLPKAHPVAPSPASALLSGILTKVGIYGILMTAMEALSDSMFYGRFILVLGLVTMLLGAVLALFSVNLKRTLACSSMSQIGFILTGCGMYVQLHAAGSEEGALVALAGTMLHMLNHSLIKLVLFTAAGVVVMNLHTLTLDDIRGWGRNKRFLKAAFALGALGISGVPLFNGYISKTLLHEGIVEGIHELPSAAAALHAAEWVFLFTGGLTFAYMLKLFLCIFVEKNAQASRQAEYDAQSACMNPLSTAAVCGPSVLMVLLGQPFIMNRIAAYMTQNEEILSFRAFAAVNLKGGAISLAIGCAVYLLFVKRVLYRNQSYVNLWPEWLDLEDLVMRPLLTRVLPGIFGSILAVFGENRILKPCGKIVLFAGSLIGRILADSVDGLIVLMRKTFVRERKSGRPDTDKMTFMRTAVEATQETADLIAGNFSFAMMMTCIGILIVLGVLVLLAVFHVRFF